MDTKINLFNPKLGIQDIMPEMHNDTLPKSKQIAVSLIRETGLEDLYNPVDLKKLLENILCPQVGDGEILRSDHFVRNLEHCAHKLKNTNDPHVQDFISKDLFPLLENEELLRMYNGLMIGG